MKIEPNTVFWVLPACGGDGLTQTTLQDLALSFKGGTPEGGITIYTTFEEAEVAEREFVTRRRAGELLANMSGTNLMLAVNGLLKYTTETY